MAFKIDVTPEDLKEQLIELFDIKKESLSLNEQDHFDRIIKGSEKKSYQKSIDYLSKL
jgi:hypothetical protein